MKTSLKKIPLLISLVNDLKLMKDGSSRQVFQNKSKETEMLRLLVRRRQLLTLFSLGFLGLLRPGEINLFTLCNFLSTGYLFIKLGMDIVNIKREKLIISFCLCQHFFADVSKSPILTKFSKSPNTYKTLLRYQILLRIVIFDHQ